MHDENKKKLQSWQHNNSIYFSKKNSIFYFRKYFEVSHVTVGKNYSISIRSTIYLSHSICILKCRLFRLKSEKTKICTRMQCCYFDVLLMRITYATVQRR